VVTNPITKGVTFFSEGYNKVYNENDEIWLDGNFKAGQLYDGKVYIYNDDGILKKIKIYKEGKFHSLGQL
jgi:antitoxin component YwqK of YwqJK toxin-antitoxin module